MPPYVVFDAQKFLEEVAKVKKFWLHTKLNKLRIETNRSESTISLYSIHKASGLETAVTIPAYISADCIMTIGLLIRMSLVRVQLPEPRILSQNR